MAEITKDFIKFVAEVIVLVLVFSVVFSPEGIASNTFNYFVYAEPILLQNYISTAITVGSQVEGNFSSTVKVTSGLTHSIKISSSNGLPYINVVPSSQVFMKTTYSKIDPTLIITNCTVPEQEVMLSTGLAEDVTVEKISTDKGCMVNIVAGTGEK